MLRDCEVTRCGAGCGCVPSAWQRVRGSTCFQSSRVSSGRALPISELLGGRGKLAWPALNQTSRVLFSLPVEVVSEGRAVGWTVCSRVDVARCLLIAKLPRELARDGSTQGA